MANSNNAKHDKPFVSMCQTKENGEELFPLSTQLKKQLNSMNTVNIKQLKGKRMPSKTNYCEHFRLEPYCGKT